MALGEIIQKLKDQEVVDVRLLAAVPILLVVGLGVYFFVGSGDGDVSNGREALGLSDEVYYCHFDQTEVIAGGQKTWDLEKEGDAIIDRSGGMGAPTRVRCTKCDRMSCFMHDRETDQPIEIDDSWDLSESAQGESRDRNVGRGGR